MALVEGHRERTGSCRSAGKPTEGDGIIGRIAGFLVAGLIAVIVAFLLVYSASTVNAATKPGVKFGGTGGAFHSLTGSPCPGARLAVSFYRRAYTWQRVTIGLPGAVPFVRYACVPTRRRAVEWRHRFRSARSARLEFLRERLIPVSNDWRTSVLVVQRAFPGTASRLLSCSGAEGGHGVWVIFGGGSYYPGAEYAYTFHGPMVGGPMQYMWGTFKGHYRRGLESLRDRGFRVHLPPVSDVAAWRSMTAQAIAAGWAFWSDNDGSHWSASAGSC